MVSFFEENFYLIYNQMDWKYMDGVKGKLKIVKREKKDEKGKVKPKKEKGKKGEK